MLLKLQNNTIIIDDLNEMLNSIYFIRAQANSIANNYHFELNAFLPLKQYILRFLQITPNDYKYFIEKISVAFQGRKEH